MGESKIFGKNEIVPTDIPMLNVALYGNFAGGLSPGMLQIVGDSKMFKTGFSLVLAKAFQDKYEDGVILFYDSEFGSPPQYFENLGLDMNRVIHTPIQDIEELKFDLVSQMDNFERGDHVMIIIDSIGGLASKKEVEDALDQKSVADMTRAKAMNSLFRIITPKLVIKHIPLLAVNHVYDEIGPMYPKKIVKGGKQNYLSSNDIWIVSRRQDKDQKTKEINGYDFVITIEKSRYVKEQSKIPITVSWENGIFKYSGLFELAMEAGLITSPTKGWYKIGNSETNVRKSEIEEDDELLSSLLEDDYFKEFVEEKYKV